MKIEGMILVLVVVGMIHTGCDSGRDDGVYQDCVDNINAYRATEDLPPLDRWKSGENCANAEAKSDAESGVAHGAFGDCGESAQNECPGWGSVDDVLDGCITAMWNEGPGDDYSKHGHYINMTNTNYTKVACGFYQGDDGVWAVMNFK